MEFCPICTVRNALADEVESSESTLEESVEPAPQRAGVS
jgi:hypothetical protein